MTGVWNRLLESLTSVVNPINTFTSLQVCCLRFYSHYDSRVFNIRLTTGATDQQCDQKKIAKCL